MFALPLVRSEKAMDEVALLADGVYTLNDHIALLVVFGLAAALALVSIFLFRNRKLQLRLVLFTLIGVLIGIGLIAGLFLQQGGELSDQLEGGLGIILPFLSILFLILAYRFIRRDDKLVRSMDRLR